MTLHEILQDIWTACLFVFPYLAMVAVVFGLSAWLLDPGPEPY